MKHINSICYDPDYGSINSDGYVRVVEGSRRDGSRRLVMRHRYMWEGAVGRIPEGYEINHLCRNRRCCNIDHLECISKSEHASKTNRDRWADQRVIGMRMLGEGFTKKEVARAVERTVHTINRWIRDETKRR